MASTRPFIPSQPHGFRAGTRRLDGRVRTTYNHQQRFPDSLAHSLHAIPPTSRRSCGSDALKIHPWTIIRQRGSNFLAHFPFPNYIQVHRVADMGTLDRLPAESRSPLPCDFPTQSSLPSLGLIDAISTPRSQRANQRPEDYEVDIERMCYRTVRLAFQDHHHDVARETAHFVRLRRSRRNVS